VDPEIEIRPSSGQIADVLKEIEIRVAKHERVLVTTLTKRMAEDLSEYLEEKGVKVSYLHSDVETLKRSDILNSLRLGEFDVLVGINLLREGLDLPEVSLVVILDADKEGFLRSRTSLIQTMGRAARHIDGHVIMYADRVTKSMDAAIEEVKRRREHQLSYNKEHGITPLSIQKPIRDQMIARVKDEEGGYATTGTGRKRKIEVKIAKNKIMDLDTINPDDLTPVEKNQYIRALTREMNAAAKAMNFERAAEIRDVITKLG
jgi:excinuclease ABC subunit B